MQAWDKVKASLGQGHTRSRQVQGKAKASSRRGAGKVERQGQGKINVRLKQSNHNHNHNYNLMGFDKIEINLVYLLDCLSGCSYIVLQCSCPRMGWSASPPTRRRSWPASTTPSPRFSTPTTISTPTKCTSMSSNKAIAGGTFCQLYFLCHPD